MRQYIKRLLYSTSSNKVRIQEETDVLIIGGGPSGLATAIRLKQLSQEKNVNLRVILLEKGAEIGSHILSGAVFEPTSLNELIPNWKELGAPLRTKVTKNQVKYLTKSLSIPLLPTPALRNNGNFIISLNDFCRWLAIHAENLGVELYPSISGFKLWYQDDGKAIQGVLTNDVGLDKKGHEKSNYEPGMSIKAKMTVLAEGSHGSLTKDAIKHFQLRNPGKFQVYALGVKEIWEVQPKKHDLGKVIHTIGYPLPPDVYGGGFIYHAADNLVYLGLISGLNYENPYFSPYQELQRYKLHPSIRTLLDGAKCIQYGARTLAQGGVQSLPKLYFPGGLLVGCAAGFLNAAKLKGSHTAMKSGIVAAEAIMDALEKDSSNGSTPLLLNDYEDRIKLSWLYKELWHVRNEKPGFQYGRMFGLVNAAFETLTHGYMPWTLQHKAPDYKCTKPVSNFKPIQYPKPDSKLTFSLLENLSRSGTNHEEDQPCHLTLADTTVPTKVNLPIYGGPESYYCPAGVYEYVEVNEPSQTPQNSTKDDNIKNTLEKDTFIRKRLQINAQNCIHCKTCDIKDPMQNINWVPPEGGGGPQYSGT